jgi:hypothetical protein
LADTARAGGDVLQETPAAHEQGEAAFTEGAHGPQQLVVGAVVHSQAAPVGGLGERDVDSDAGALIAGAGQRGQTPGGIRVQRAEGVILGAGQVVHGSGFDLADPDR